MPGITPASAAVRRLTPAVTLRAARRSDYAFAAGLYLEGTQRWLSTLGMWDEDRATARFAQAFKPELAQVIRCDGADIGWMQVSESAEGFHLHQFHLVERFRNRGIGTGLIAALQDRARALSKPIALNVMRGNPAIVLYQRLGFRVTSEDEEKFHMRWGD